MVSELRVRFFEDREGKPGVMVCNFPGLDADFSPSKLRSLADALYMAADDAEHGPVHRRAGMGKGDASYDY